MWVHNKLLGFLSTKQLVIGVALWYTGVYGDGG